MFTPPPSPLPPLSGAVDPLYGTQMCTPIPDTSLAPSKRWSHRSIPRTVVLVPLSLILLAAFTRFWAHPAVFDLLLADRDHEWTGWKHLLDRPFHAPHGVANNHKRYTSDHLAARDTASTPTAPTNPVLPTPFPQPFDTTLSANFSTTSCYDFFLNMTQTYPFRSCRPFSLLLLSSYAFSEAQRDLDLLNTEVWGTCNTDISQVQCDANMSWFASSLQTSCQTDLTDQVEMAVSTLYALEAYELMRNVGCQLDPATGSYCYVEAVADPDPSTSLFYRLALGYPINANITTSACTNCTAELMESYDLALKNPNGITLGGLEQTYKSASQELDKVCGATYAKAPQESITNSAWVNVYVPGTSVVAVGVLAVLLSGML